MPIDPVLPTATTSTLPQGLHGGPPAPAGGPSARSPGSAHLSDLVADHTFLHQLLLPRLGIPDPVPIYYAEAGLKDYERPYQILLQQPFLIAGLPPPLDRIVYAVPTDCWPGLARYLDCLAFQDSSRKAYYNVIRQLIPVPDRTSLQPVSYPVHFLGLAGNEFCFHYRPLPGGLIELKRDAPLPETVSLAKALFSDSGDPFATKREG